MQELAKNEEGNTDGLLLDDGTVVRFPALRGDKLTAHDRCQGPHHDRRLDL